MQFNKIMLGLGIGVLAALFLAFFVDAIYPAPVYDDFCLPQFYSEPMKNPYQNTCNYTYDVALEQECSKGNGMIEYTYNEKGCISGETCNYCGAEFMNANKKYSQNLFDIMAPIALVMIIFGLYLPATIDAIAGGILFGGILTMIQITIRVFDALDKWPRVILLGIELAIVIWVGLKKIYSEVLKKGKK